MSGVPFAILRHAATAWNEERRLQGLTDTVLSAAGEADARSWHLPPPAAGWPRMSSPLQRARTVVRAATRGRGPVREDIPAEISEERDHALASIALRCTSARAHAARTKAAAKLGSEAPPHGSACGCRSPTSRVHQRGPSG